MANHKFLTPAQRRQIYKAAYPRSRSPYGGMSIQGKAYRTGQFLPNKPPQESTQRHTYEKSKPCDGHCGCNHCAADQALDHVIYSRSERHRQERVNRILYESKKYNQQESDILRMITRICKRV